MGGLPLWVDCPCGYHMLVLVGVPPVRHDPLYKSNSKGKSIYEDSIGKQPEDGDALIRSDGHFPGLHLLASSPNTIKMQDQERGREGGRENLHECVYIPTHTMTYLAVQWVLPNISSQLAVTWVLV